MSEPQCMECMKEFDFTIVKILKETLLQIFNEEEIKPIEKRYSLLEFLGCIETVDCAGWQWRNFPIGWKGTVHKISIAHDNFFQ